MSGRTTMSRRLEEVKQLAILGGGELFSTMKWENLTMKTLSTIEGKAGQEAGSALSVGMTSPT